MKTTENFYAAPDDVLKGALRQGPAAVLVVCLDDHGGISVFGSHSTPVTMLLAKQAIPAIFALAEPDSSEA